MAKWNWKIDLSQEFSDFNDNEDFAVFKEKALQVIEASEAYKANEDDLEGTLQGLKDAEDAEQWDEQWAEFYDACDELRIWVQSI